MKLLPNFIEIETSSKCNRTCSWCPVGVLKTRKHQTYMAWNLFEKIIKDLYCLNYTGTIALHNYNEPLLNARIFDEIQFVKTTLPNVKIVIFTNGDYVNFDTIRHLSTSKLDILRITIYPEKIIQESSETVLNKWIKKHNLKSLCWEFENMPDNKGVCYKTTFEKTCIKAISPNIQTYNTRANLVRPLVENKRLKPCNMTTVSAAIDYLGRFKMCCNIFPEAEIHKEYIIGDLSTKSFSELWYSDFMNLVREKHLRADWSMSQVCEKCFKLNENE